MSHRNRRDKLTRSDVLAIKRLLYNQELSQEGIALRYQISQSHVSKIANEHIYANVPWPNQTDDGITMQPHDVIKQNTENIISPSFDAVENELHVESVQAQAVEAEHKRWVPAA